MDEATFRVFLATRTAIEAHAKAVFQILARHWGCENPTAWDVDEIASEGVYLSDYCHGDTDTVLVRLAYLVADDPEALIMADRKAYHQAQAEQLLADREAMERRQEVNERATLDRLIAKYGVPDGTA